MSRNVIGASPLAVAGGLGADAEVDFWADDLPLSTKITRSRCVPSVAWSVAPAAPPTMNVVKRDSIRAGSSTIVGRP